MKIDKDKLKNKKNDSLYCKDCKHLMADRCEHPAQPKDLVTGFSKVKAKVAREKKNNCGPQGWLFEK